MIWMFLFAAAWGVVLSLLAGDWFWFWLMLFAAAAIPALSYSGGRK